MGDRERSDAFFISILQSPDTIYGRVAHDAISLTNSANALAETGLYREAIGLYELSLPIMINETDYSFASGIVAGMAESYIGLGDWNMAKHWADTSLRYIREHIHYMNLHRARQIFPILPKYHLHKGEKITAAKYIDSL